MSHAVLAPSASHRWLECPPSARLEENFPDSETTAAAEGTFAHRFAEVELNYFLNEIESGEYKAEMSKLKADNFYSGSLEENVTMYTGTVIEKFMAAKKLDETAILLTEQKFDLSEYVPESYGHADAVIVSDNTLDIVDLKYGAGVPVKAKDNPQLRLYALGVYSDLSFLYGRIKNVTATIVQPRNGGISSETLTTDELLTWGKKIKPIAELAFKGEGEFKAGAHCKFCRAANRCKALAAYQLEQVKEEFDDPALLNDEELSAILIRADPIIKWLNNVKDYALKESVENGKRWDGLKVVEGRSVRKIVDEVKAAELLGENGGTDDKIWKPKELLGITALEKNFGKNRLGRILGELIHKPVGKPALVLESDPRPEWHSVKDEFEILEDEHNG